MARFQATAIPIQSGRPLNCSFAWSRDRMTTPSYIHIERYRPGRLFYFVAGIFCAFALGMIAPTGAALFMGVILCGALLFVGAPAVLGGAAWESWIYRGRVHGVRTGRLWGHWDSCPVEDVTEFRPAAGATPGAGENSHVLVLTDGTERAIDCRCIGDASAFLQALKTENPRIQCTTEAQTAPAKTMATQ